MVVNGNALEWSVLVMRVLVCGFESSSTDQIACALRIGGAVVEVVQDEEEISDFSLDSSFDVIIFDLIKPSAKTWQILRSARKHGELRPVLILAEVDEVDLRLQAFGSGADDYLVKPWQTDYLLARTRSIMRRSYGFSEAVLKVGELHLDTEDRKARVLDSALSLTNTEYTVLEQLTLRKGAIIGRQALLDHLYDNDDAPYDQVIDVVVCRLRKKLARSGASELINTVRGRGYSIRWPLISKERSHADCDHNAA